MSEDTVPIRKISVSENRNKQMDACKVFQLDRAEDKANRSEEAGPSDPIQDKNNIPDNRIDREICYTKMEKRISSNLNKINPVSRYGKMNRKIHSFSNKTDFSTDHMKMERRELVSLNKINPESGYIKMERRISSVSNTINPESCYIKMERRISNVSNTNNSEDCYIKMERKLSTVSNTNYSVEEQIQDIVLNSERLSYNVPDFNMDMTPLKERRNYLFGYPSIYITSDINSEIFFTMKLREEATYPGGVEVEITKSDLQGLKLVSSFGNLWISGPPKTKDLRGPIRLGDHLISVDDENINSVSNMENIMNLKHKKEFLKLRLRRLPHAKIFVVNIKTYKSVLNFNEKMQAYELGTDDSARNEIWYITEVDGISLANIFQQKELRKYFIKDPDQYISIVVHTKSFITNYLKLTINNNSN